MAIPVKLGTTTKRVNSTLVPDATDWPQIQVTLKADTSLERPVFILSGSAATFYQYNYLVGAGILQGFYWITDIVSIANNRVEIHCVRDVLANNRAAILNTNAFIEFGQNTFDAGAAANRVSDPRQTISKTPAQYQTTVDITGGITSTTGIYVLQAVSQNQGVVTYVLNRGTLDTLLSQINTDLNDAVDNIIQSGSSPDAQLAELAALDLRKSLLQESALDAIQSCFWLPINRMPINQTRIYLGNWDTTVPAARLASDAVYSVQTSIAIPWPVADWRRANCQLVLYLPFMGTVPIPVDQCINMASLDVTWSLEYFTGNVAVTVKAGNYTVFTGNANIAASVAVGRNAVNASSTVTGAIQAIGGGLQVVGGALDAGAGIAGIAASTATAGILGGGGQLTAGINTMVTGAGNIFGGYQQMVQPAITCAGSMSGLAGAGQPLNAQLCLMYYAPLDDAGFSSVYGHPVMKIAQPALGFCKTRGFSLAAADRVGDISIVNAAMDGGVFIE